MSQPLFGDGTTLEVDDGSGYWLIPNLVELTPPAPGTLRLERRRIEESNRQERIPGRADLGELIFAYENSAATFARIHALLPSSPLEDGSHSWRIAFPDGMTFTFSGFLHRHKLDRVEGEKVVISSGRVQLTSSLTVTTS